MGLLPRTIDEEIHGSVITCGPNAFLARGKAHAPPNNLNTSKTGGEIKICKSGNVVVLRQPE